MSVDLYTQDHCIHKQKHLCMLEILRSQVTQQTTALSLQIFIEHHTQGTYKSNKAKNR
jgi:hypothetical protein